MNARIAYWGCLLVLAVRAEFNASSSVIVLQGFDWNALSNRGSLYSTIQSQASTIASAGFYGVWFPPPSESVDTQGYLPQRWYTLVSESNLRNAINTIKSKGVIAISDVVVNHRTAPKIDSCLNMYTVFEDPDMGNWAVTSNDCGNKASSCGCGHVDTGDDVSYANDLDHIDDRVQSAVKDFLNFLKNDVGFQGWRFDMVKGYGASYVGDYVSSSSPLFSVGEYWDSSTSRVMSWIDGTGGRSQAFDFPLRYTLQSAIKSNTYTSLGWMVPGVAGQDPSHAVTFTDNHDTSRDDRFGSSDQILMGYAYLLTHPGTPCVFWTDWNTGSMQSAIKSMMNIRISAGITATTSVNIKSYESGLYAAYIGSNVAMKLGTSSWSPSDAAYKLATSGNNYAIWVK